MRIFGRLAVHSVVVAAAAATAATLTFVAPAHASPPVQSETSAVAMKAPELVSGGLGEAERPAPSGGLLDAGVMTHPCGGTPNTPYLRGGSGGVVFVRGTNNCDKDARVVMGIALPGDDWAILTASASPVIGPGQTGVASWPCRWGRWNYRGYFEWEDGRWTAGPIRTITC